MEKGLNAVATVRINAPIDIVWDALTTPEIIKKYMFGTEVHSNWKEGRPITWSGTWEGKPYEDRGTILKVVKEETLQYTHYSPMSGLPDVPENYHTLTYHLSTQGEQTLVALTQDNNLTEKMKEDSQKMWEMMLTNLKNTLEK